MKYLKHIMLCASAACLATACNEGIDPISPLAPGEDKTAPAITINYPSEGTLVRVKESVTAIDIKLDIKDDIELKTISLKIDGTEIAKFDKFKDYRHAILSHVYDQLTDGSHTLSVSAVDLSDKTTTQTVTFQKAEPYKPMAGETFYVPFDGEYTDMVNIAGATVVGSPKFNNAGKLGKAYEGAIDAYLTMPTVNAGKGINLTTPEFSAALWYKLNATPDRAGILTISADDPSKAANLKNDRSKGFRLFREGSATKQTFKLNVGNGTADVWVDGGDAASLNPTTTGAGWVHLAFTISGTEAIVYINGQAVKQAAITGANWEGCDQLSIGSGAPYFTEWNHKSDCSLMDDLRFFNKALTQNEIQAIMNTVQ